MNIIIQPERNEMKVESNTSTGPKHFTLIAQGRTIIAR